MIRPAVEWPWLLVPLLAWGLPLAGIFLGSVVARRWGWRMLVAGCAVWGAIGAAVFAVPTGDSLADAVAIAVWLFVVPWLLAGALTRLVLQRRERQRVADQR
jgi:biotin transporter BioY